MGQPEWQPPLDMKCYSDGLAVSEDFVSMVKISINVQYFSLKL